MLNLNLNAEQTHRPRAELFVMRFVTCLKASFVVKNL